MRRLSKVTSGSRVRPRRASASATAATGSTDQWGRRTWGARRPTSAAMAVMELVMHRLAERIERTPQVLPARATVLAAQESRHATRGGAIAQTLTAQGFQVAQRSRGEPVTAQTQIYLADTMGELGLFYRLCKIVVMGGSFADIGGHNPIEAAPCGALIIFGPSRRNFVGICEDFKNSNGMIFIDSAEELGPLLQEAFTQPARFDLIAQSGYDWVSQKSNIARDLVAQVASFLPKNSPDMNKEVA